jgi:hypothetical protein
MSLNLKQWFVETIRERVLNVLDVLAAEFKEDGKPDWRKAVEVFSVFCENKDKLDPQLKNVVDKVINGLSLTDEVKALNSHWLEIHESVRDILTKPLQGHREPIKWNVLGRDGEGLSYGNLIGPLNSLINFNAKADLELALQALDCDAAGKAIGIECEGQERLLKMGLLGKLEASTDASLPIGFVGIKGKGEVRGKASLDYYFGNKAQWLFIEALIHDLTHLASPFDAADIAAEQAYSLKAIQLSVEGSLGASLSLTAGKTWGTSFKVKNKRLDLDTYILIGASVDLGYDVDLNLEGAWNVLVKPKDTGFLNVKVQKDRSKEKSTSFSLDVSVGISGLDKVGEVVINRYLPDPTLLLEKLHEYSNFGSLLKTEVKNKLKELLNADTDDTLENKLVEVLVGDDNAGKLADVIGSAVEASLNEKLDLLLDEASNAGKTIIEGVVNKLDLKKRLGNELTNKLVNTAAGKLAEFLNCIVDKLKNSLEEIINNDDLELIFKPLEAIGETVEDLIEKASQGAQQLLIPFIRFLTRYQQQRNKIVKAVQASSRLKLGLHLGRSLKSSSGISTVLDFEVDTNNSEAGKYYKEMVAGNFQNALAAARKSKNGSNGIKLCGGSFKSAVSNQLTTDVSLSFFGAQFSSQTIMNSDVQVQVDTAGNIMMAQSEAEFKRIYSGLGESRMVQFLNLMEIPGSISNGDGEDGDANHGKIKIFSSGMAMTYRDNRLKESELEAYLGSLEEAKLISKESLNAAETRYDELVVKAADEEKKMGAEIGLSMALTPDDIRTLTETQNTDIENKAIDHQLGTYFFGKPEKCQFFQEVTARWYDRSKNLKEQIRKIAAKSTLGDVLATYDIPNIHARNDRNKVVSISAEERHYLRMARRIGINANNLVNIVQNLREAAKIQFTEHTLEDDVKTLAGYNKEINESLRGWLKVRGILRSLGLKKETVPSVVLAFIATIGEICQLGGREKGTEFLIPTVKWSVLDWKEEIFV